MFSEASVCSQDGGGCMMLLPIWSHVFFGGVVLGQCGPYGLM